MPKSSTAKRTPAAMSSFISRSVCGGQVGQAGLDQLEHQAVPGQPGLGDGRRGRRRQEVRVARQQARQVDRHRRPGARPGAQPATSPPRAPPCAAPSGRGRPSGRRPRRRAGTCPGRAGRARGAASAPGPRRSAPRPSAPTTGWKCSTSSSLTIASRSWVSIRSASSAPRMIASSASANRPLPPLLASNSAASAKRMQVAVPGDPAWSRRRPRRRGAARRARASRGRSRGAAPGRTGSSAGSSRARCDSGRRWRCRSSRRPRRRRWPRCGPAGRAPGSRCAGCRRRWRASASRPPCRSTSAQTTTNSSPGAARGRCSPPGSRLRRRCGELDEQLVAGVVAQRVVDPLEVVEVAEQHAGAPRGRAGEQPGHRRCVSARRFGRPVSSSCIAWWRSDASTSRARGDVGEHHEVGDAAVVVHRHRHVQLAPHRLGVRAAGRRARGCAGRARGTTSSPSPPSPAGRASSGVAGSRPPGGARSAPRSSSSSARRPRSASGPSPSSRHSAWLALMRRSSSSKSAMPTGATASRSVKRWVEARSRSSAWRRSVTSSTVPTVPTLPGAAVADAAPPGVKCSDAAAAVGQAHLAGRGSTSRRQQRGPPARRPARGRRGAPPRAGPPGRRTPPAVERRASRAAPARAVSAPVGEVDLPAARARRSRSHVGEVARARGGLARRRPAAVTDDRGTGALGRRAGAAAPATTTRTGSGSWPPCGAGGPWAGRGAGVDRGRQLGGRSTWPVHAAGRARAHGRRGRRAARRRRAAPTQCTARQRGHARVRPDGVVVGRATGWAGSACPGPRGTPSWSRTTASPRRASRLCSRSSPRPRRSPSRMWTRTASLDQATKESPIEVRVDHPVRGRPRGDRDVLGAVGKDPRTGGP